MLFFFLQRVLMILNLVVLADNQEIIGNPINYKEKTELENVCFQCQSAQKVKELKCGHFLCSACTLEQGCEYCGLFMSAKDFSTIVKSIEKDVESRKGYANYPKDCEEHQGVFELCLHCKKRMCVECSKNRPEHEHKICLSEESLQKEVEWQCGDIMSNYKEAINKHLTKIKWTEKKMRELESAKQLLHKRLDACNNAVLGLQHLSVELGAEYVSPAEAQIAAKEEGSLLAIFDYLDSTFWGYETAVAMGQKIDSHLSYACKSGNIEAIRKLFKLFSRFPVMPSFLTHAPTSLTCCQVAPEWKCDEIVSLLLS